MKCDHCGAQKSGALPTGTRIAWCIQCIKEEHLYLRSLNLESFSSFDIDNRIKTNSWQEFGLPQNINKLGAIPKKASMNQQYSIPTQFTIGSKVKVGDVPLGTEVEYSGIKGTIVAKGGSSSTIAWKIGDARTYNGAYDITKAASGAVSGSGEKLQTLSQYSLGYNVANSDLITVIAKPIRIGDFPLGTRVKWSGLIGTIIGNYAGSSVNGSAAIGWKLGEEPYVAAQQNFLVSKSYNYIPNKENYVNHYWVNNNTQIEVLESEGCMKISELQIGQEIEWNGVKGIIAGNHTSSGERLFVSKDPFLGTSKHTKSNDTKITYTDKVIDYSYSIWLTSLTEVIMIGERIGKFGLKLGDKVVVFRRKNDNSLMDTGAEADTSRSLIGTVAGFNALGEANVWFDPAQYGNIQGNSTATAKAAVDKSYMDKVDQNYNNFWLIRTDKAFIKIEIKENKMSNEKNGQSETKPTFVEMMRTDMSSAAYRVAANQMSKGIKGAILMALEKKGTDGGKVAAIAEMLDTEVGQAAISMMIGLALTYLPHVSADPRAQRLAGEFRVESMTMVGNTLLDTVVEHFLPVITGALNALPQETPAVRVSTPPVEETKSVDKLALEEAAREEAEKAAEPQAKQQQA